MKKRIFILGTGRSGTHLLGNVLGGSTEIYTNVEKWPIFGWVTMAAIEKRKRKILLPFIVLYYWLRPIFLKKHFMEKSHPNIWLIESYLKYIPGCYMIGIARDPHETVSSMLLHEGVMRWIYNWDRYSIPNDFLNINEKNIDEYRNMSLASKCTMRWISHKRKLNMLSNKYPQKFLLVDYDNLLKNTHAELVRIAKFLQLKSQLPMPMIKMDSKLKWKNNLNLSQIHEINTTLINNGMTEFIKE